MNTSKNNRWTVYRHVSPSGKVYIGITKNSTTRRWGLNGNGYKHSTLFQRAIEKYGWDNIKHEILFQNLSEEKAKHLEIELIRHYKNLNLSYNCTDGGDGTVGWHPSEETKAIWKSQRKGRIITEGWKRKISESTKGKTPVREASIKGAQRVKELKSKPVVQFSLSGELIKVFPSIKEAARILGNCKKNSEIIKCCNKKLHSTAGFLWMYKTDFEEYTKAGILQNKIDELVLGNKNKWTNKTEEHVRKLREACVESRRKAILQLSLDDEPLFVYPSGMSIERKFKYDASFIGQCCNGKYSKAYGYKWKYITKEEYEKFKLQTAA